MAVYFFCICCLTLHCAAAVWEEMCGRMAGEVERECAILWAVVFDETFGQVMATVWCCTAMWRCSWFSVTNRHCSRRAVAD